MSANVDYTTGAVARLDRVAGNPAPITERDAEDSSFLARTLVGLLRDTARLTGLWRPRRVDFTRVVLDDTGTTLFRLEHRLGGAVRYWVVGWDGAAPANIRADAATTDDVLVLTSTSAGTATIRVEEAG